MSPYMTHGGQCLHACHMAVNVSMHVTWQSMSPCMSHGVKCLHTYHLVSNVFVHVTWRSISPCIAHKPKSTNSDWPVSKRQDESERTSQSPPTAADQFEKDKTSGSVQALLQFTHTSYSLPIAPTVYPYFLQVTHNSYSLPIIPTSYP